MNLNTLNEFRHAVYGCFKQARDALFNTMDALSSETAAHSFPELSLSPLFQRKWASLYEAFEDGKIDAAGLREVFVQFAPLPCASEHVFLGVDTSNLFRPESTTSADRTLVPIPNLPESSHAVSPGWVVSHVVLLPAEAGQGTFVLDCRRLASTELATEVGAGQLKAVVELLVQRGLRPVIIGDRWYACAPFLARMSDMPASCLLRVKSNRVFYRRAPARTPGQRRASRKDGARFQCKNESSHGEPDASWEGTDAKGLRVEVRCWNQLHLRTGRWVEVSVIQVIRHGASERPRDPKVSWFLGKETSRHLWPRSAQPTACVTRMSMATAWTSTFCFGTSHVCALRRKRNAGRKSSLVLTTSWFWPVLWQEASIDRGKHARRF